MTAIPECAVTRYIETMKEKIKLENELRVTENIAKTRKENTKERFDDIIEKIKKEQSNIITELNQQTAIKTDELKKLISEPYIKETIDDFERKLRYLQMKKTIKNIEDFSDKEIHHRIVEKLGTLYRDDFLIIKAYIVENRKPKNKFSLIVYGKTSFDRPVFDFSPPYIIQEKPTSNELKEYYKNSKDTVFSFSLVTNYKKIKEEYLDTIKNNSFIQTVNSKLKIPVLTDKEAPVVCTIDKRELRLYNSYYYEQVGKMEKKPDLLTLLSLQFHYIKVNNRVYQKSCRYELMRITQTGNTDFGNWWSMSIESNEWHGGVYFNERNYNKEVKERIDYIEKKNKKRLGEKIHFSPPKVVWIHPELVRKNPIERDSIDFDDE
jgi:hypothetical protein